MRRILLATDPDSFASLVLLNSNWRRVSQQAHLYAHHLARSPSYASSHIATSSSLLADRQLSQLRSTFAREVKRNLFEAYTRPTETRITLISNSISSSSCPGGEGLQFTASPKGHYVLAYNSSRIHVIDVRGPAVQVKREFKVLRRPASVCMQDDASLLAVLSSDLQVDVFNLEKSPPKRLQSILLDHRPRTIALSPCGSVLAAAYDGGIEVTSLNPGSMTAKRAVKCEPVDTLAFSLDGTQLLGTTSQALAPNTVILTAPYYDPGSHMGQENASALWTTSILFPNTTRDCSHAALLQDSGSEEAAWTFTYDRSFETFRAVRIDDLRNGTTYFTGPIP
ncbi:WD40 repeat domain-containing protein, partial [Candidatus Bathyarchaeota archaeon]|nr:WD40 repeat domain-containing protein [Candidatus Bathyarchaeota archaeon]